MRADRSYPVPSRVSDRESMTIDEMDLMLSSGRGTGAERAWASERVEAYVASVVADVCGDDVRAPVGLVSSTGDVDVVVALGRGRECWTGSTWSENVPEYDDVVSLDRTELAFAADALASGHGLALRAAVPLAFIGRRPVAAAVGDVASQLKVVAVVDEEDKSAVMELLAVAPGPVVYRRHDGSWKRDNAWLRSLRGFRPPPIVVLDAETARSVAAQVDEATLGKEFDEALAASFTPYDVRALDMKIEFMLASAIPLDVALTAAMPAKLMKYWTVGRGGVTKIRWGSPGAWRRCHRQLRRYMNDYSARGACTNLGKIMGGRNVAWNVSGD